MIHEISKDPKWSDLLHRLPCRRLCRGTSEIWVRAMTQGHELAQWKASLMVAPASTAVS